MKNRILNNIKKDNQILSGYIRYRPRNGTYYLAVNSRILATHISKGSKVKVKTLRNKKLFMVCPDKEGNVFKPLEKELITCISGLKLLKTKEREFLMAEDTKFSFPVKIEISPFLFDLKRFDLYPDQDAAKLAYYLEENGMKMPARIMTPKAFDHDLEFDFKNRKIMIEITRTKPADKNGECRNFKHQPTGSIIRSQIFDIFLDCLKDRNNFGINIIDKKWKKYKHIVNLVDYCKKIDCHILFVDFSKNWDQECMEYIIKNVKRK